MKYKKGDKVTIVANSNEHEYPIGIEVTIIREGTSVVSGEKEYYASHPKEGDWYVLEEDVTIGTTEEQKLLLGVYKKLDPNVGSIWYDVERYLLTKGLIDKLIEP